MIINEKTTSYYTFNTSLHLLNAYEEMAILLNRNAKQYDNSTDEISIVSSDRNVAMNLALINLNAAIVEGTIRQVFTSIIANDHNRLGKIAQSSSDPNDMSKIYRSYQKLKQLHLELELSGGWDSLKSHIFQYLDFKIEDHMGDKEAFTVLFTLRNSTAHGTALVIPAEPIPEDQKHLYPYKWQSKLHGIEMYVQRHFQQGLFESLRNPFFSKKFMDETIFLMSNIKKSGLMSGEQEFLMHNFESFSFGQKSLYQWHKTQK